MRPSSNAPNPGVKEQDRASVLLRQRAERLVQILLQSRPYDVHLDRPLLAFKLRAVRKGIGQNLPFGKALTPHPLMLQYTKAPGLQIGSRFKLVSGPQRVEAGLLYQVLNLFPAMRQPPGEAIKRIEMLKQQSGKPLLFILGQRYSIHCKHIQLIRPEEPPGFPLRRSHRTSPPRQWTRPERQVPGSCRGSAGPLRSTSPGCRRYRPWQGLFAARARGRRRRPPTAG